MNEIIIPESDLPIWMRKAKQGTDWGVLVVLAFCLLAAWPFILRAEIPQNSALENYAFRTAEYARSFEELWLYPRWSATAINGYGAPIPHFSAPGVAYLGGVLDVLVTGDPVDALRLVLILAYLMMGALTYAFVTRFAGAAMGVLAAMLYVFSPHALMTVPYALGDAPQLAAMAIYPAILWSQHRLLTMHRPADFTLATLAVSAMILFHPASVPVALQLSLVMAVWHISNGDHKPRIALIVFAWIFAACLTAFYWFPAWQEHDLVQWQEPSIEPRSLHLSLSGLFGLPEGIDPQEFVLAPRLVLGVGIIVFALLGAVSIAMHRTWTSIPALMLVCGIALLGWGLLLSPASTWLLGPVVLCLAVGGADAVSLRDYLPDGLREWVLAGLLALALILAYPGWLPPRWEDTPLDTSTGAMLSYEQQGLGVAVLPGDAQIPMAMEQGIPPNFTMITSYQNDDEVVRVRSDQVTVGREMTIRTGEIHRDEYIITADVAQIDIMRANFAGWTARLNGHRIQLLTDEATGLMRVVLPPTDSATLTIEMEPTRTRQRGWWLATAAAVLLVAGFAVRLQHTTRPHFYGLRLLDIREARLVMAVLAGYIGGLVLVASPQSPYNAYEPAHVLAAMNPVDAATEDGMSLIGYQVRDDAVAAGDTLEITLAWQAQRTLNRNYSAALVLEQIETGARIARSSPQIPGSFPTRRWPLEGFLRDTHELQIPPFTLPGRYRLVVEVYDCSPVCSPTTRRFFVDENDEQLGLWLALPVEIEVR